MDSPRPSDITLPLSDPTPEPSPLAITDEELDMMETLAEFEAEHRRILAMQSLYYRRHRAVGDSY